MRCLLALSVLVTTVCLVYQHTAYKYGSRWFLLLCTHVLKPARRQRCIVEPQLQPIASTRSPSCWTSSVQISQHRKRQPTKEQQIDITLPEKISGKKQLKSIIQFFTWLCPSAAVAVRNSDWLPFQSFPTTALLQAKNQSSINLWADGRQAACVTVTN